MDTITVNGVEYVRKGQAGDTRYNDLIEAIKSELALLVENAQLAYNDYSMNGFTANSIEAEGFLRGVKTAEGHILEQLRWSQEDL